MIASIHRREQQLAGRNQELSKREQAILAKEAEVESRSKQWDTKKKLNVFEALKELGYDDGKAFLKMVAETGGEMTPEQRELHELKQWRQQQEQAESKRAETAKQEKEAASYKQSVDQWHNGIAHYIKQDDDLSKSVLALPNAQASVFQTLQEHFQKTGERLEVSEAAQLTREKMGKEMREALKQIGSVPEGLSILQEILAKLAPVQAKRGKSTAQTGLSNAVRNETRSAPLEDVDIDTALAQATAYLRENGRR